MTSWVVMLPLTFWVLSGGLYCVLALDNDFDCYYEKDKGKGYDGQASRPDCLNWKDVSSSPFAQYNEDHNYCRNPIYMSKPFCFTSYYNYMQCDIPICDSECYTNKGKRYYGSATKPGCLKWSQVNYESLNFYENHNFCRNPMPNRLSRPWCFTNATTFAFQFCDVEKCRLVKRCQAPKPTVHLTWQPVKTTYYIGDAIVYSCKNVISLSYAIISVCQENETWTKDQPNCGEKVHITTDITDISKTTEDDVVQTTFSTLSIISSSDEVDTTLSSHGITETTDKSETRTAHPTLSVTNSSELTDFNKMKQTCLEIENWQLNLILIFLIVVFILNVFAIVYCFCKRHFEGSNKHTRLKEPY